ncbi:MAG: hypothetical protein HYX92_20095 [Chloroflexi bacterium]|nr:hypothetical protein [Chloroflexota bacterium]
MGQLTDAVPKPLVRVKDKPFLEHQLALLKKNGISRALLLVGYLGHMIEAYFGDGSRMGFGIEYSYEDSPLGTGGALASAGEKLDEEFLLLNGDTFLDLDYQDLVKYFEALDRIGVVVAYKSSGGGLRSNLRLGADNRVIGYSKGGGEDMRFVDAGVSVYKKSVLDFIPKGRAVSLEQEVFPLLIERQQLWGYPCERPFYDMGTFRGLEEAGRVLE